MNMVLSILLFVTTLGLVKSELLPIVIDVDLNPGTSYSSQLGCPLTLECYGQGTSIKWIKFPSSVAIPNSTNTFVTKYYLPATGTWESSVNFKYFTEANQGFYMCQITATVSRSMSVQVQYDPSPIQIAAIPDVNISQYMVADTLTVGCPLTTCASEVTLTISPSATVQQNVIRYANTVTNNVQNFVFKVNSNLPGTYTVTAQGTFYDGSAYTMYSATQIFNIIGTPMPQATTPPPSGSTTSTPSKGGSPGSVASLTVQVFSLVLTVTLAALLSIKV